MTTVINTPAAQTTDSGSNNIFGFVLGAMVVIGIIALVFYMSMPIANQAKPTQQTIDAPRIVIPDTIDVNVQNDK